MDRVLIAGAGVFGVTAAIELRKRGHPVMLVDAGPLPHPLAASTDISKVVRLEYGADEPYTALAERALEGWRRWNRDLGLLYHETGLLLLRRTPLSPGTLEQDSLEVVSRRGHRAELLDAEKVRARFPVVTTDDATTHKETKLADGSGDEMQYDDAARKATFRIKAHLISPDGDITADRIVVSLAQNDNSVERLEAEGALTLKETDRVTTGEKLVYVLAENESYTVTGKPAKMVEKGCHVNTGTTLNFEKSTDKLRIDGNDETRTQTKTEGKCIESHD